MAAEQVKTEDLLRLLDYPAYFELSKPSQAPSDPESIAEALLKDNLIQRCPAGGWDILNLGALLFAKELENFQTVQRKAMRIVQYQGSVRGDILMQKLCRKGYANGFEELVAYVDSLLPHREPIKNYVRKKWVMYPDLAVRELIANALIHQDLSISGTGPVVEIFDKRIEFSNPGQPLIPAMRFLDSPPRSRNEKLAKFMRRFGLCEELGTGFDKVVLEAELHKLPAPVVETTVDATRVTLSAAKDIGDMRKEERILACYLHASICWIYERKMTNTSLRERLGIPAKNSAKASRLLKEAVDAELIAVRDPFVGTRSRTYIPFWAVSKGNGQ